MGVPEDLTEEERAAILREAGIDPNSGRSTDRDCPTCDAPAHPRAEFCQSCGHSFIRTGRRKGSRRSAKATSSSGLSGAGKRRSRYVPLSQKLAAGGALLLVIPCCLSWGSAPGRRPRTNREPQPPADYSPDQNPRRAAQERSRPASSRAIRRTERDLRLEARVLAQEAVRARLKAPSTANFPWGDWQVARGGKEGQWLVRSYVDAQNALGAQIRSHFVVELQETSQGLRVAAVLLR